MNDLRDKINKIIRAEAFPVWHHSDYLTDRILALLEQCTAMTIEDCPWGKKNVEFREIFLRGMNR